MNKNPYVRGYVCAALVGVPLSYALSGPLGLGSWGLVIGQAASQAMYNNWKWPMYLAGRLGTSYRALFRQGIEALKARVEHLGA